MKINPLIVVTVAAPFTISLNAAAQSNLSLSGTVKASNNQQIIAYPNINLYNDSLQQHLLLSTVGDSLGTFKFDDLTAGKYYLSIDADGFSKKTYRTIITNSNVTLSNLTLSVQKSEEQDLNSVTISANSTNKLIDNQIDKTVYNVENDVAVQSSSAIDALKRVPQVSVDADGSVDLLGSSNVRFLINGQNSSAFGDDISEVLASIPANQIKKIEIMTSPGSKYDAEGTGGVINIVLKNTFQPGIMGSANLSVGTLENNGSLNLSAQKGKFGIRAFASGDLKWPATDKMSMDRNSVDTTTGDNTQLLQNGTGRFKRHGYQTGISGSWTPSENDVLNVSFSYLNHGMKNTNKYLQSTNVFDAGNNLLNSQDANYQNQVNRGMHTIQESLNYKHTFKPGQFLEFNFNNSNTNGHGNTFQNAYLETSNDFLSGLSTTNPGSNRLTEFSLDYTQPIVNHLSISLGGKTALSKLNSNTASYNLLNDGYDEVYNTALSNDLTYKQNVYAGYASINYSLPNFFDILAGIRYERTNLSPDFSNAPDISIPNYNTWIPSFTISHQFDNSQRLQFSYSRRIKRPNYRFLNPSINVQDPKNLTTGNPFLSPEKADMYQLAYNKDFGHTASINLSGFWRHNTNDIQQYVVYYPEYLVGDSTYDNVSVNTYQNIGKEDQFGGSLFATFNPFTPLTLRGNLTIFNKRIVGIYNPSDIVNSINTRLTFNASYQITPCIIAEAFGSYKSARTELQGRYPKFINYTFAIRKDILNKNASIGLTATNPFARYVKMNTTITGTNFTLDNNKLIPFRSFGITFSYKFGNKNAFAKQNNKQEQKEEDASSSEE